MRCVTAEEALALWGPLGFKVNDEQRWYRRELVLDRGAEKRQARRDASPPSDPRSLPAFIMAANRWLSVEPGARLLWVQHWEWGNPYDSEAFVRAALLGAAEPRSFDEAPGCLFDPHPYENLDFTEMAPEHTRELGFLVGLMSMLIVTGSDGWLLAEGSTDRVEVWEGNILFYSDDAKSLERAKSLLRSFDCPKMK